MHTPASLIYWFCGEEHEAVIEIKAFPFTSSTRALSAVPANPRKKKTYKCLCIHDFALP